MIIFLKIILLGIVQGLTEFLPVSSSGHLILFQRIIGFTQNEFLVDISVHFGTLIAVIVFFRKKIALILKEIFNCFKRFELDKIKLPLLILVGSIPAGMVGFTISNFVAQKLWNVNVVVLCFVITGLLLFVSEKNSKEKIGLKKIKFTHAFTIGIFQAFALLPGISRSGFTISSALLFGVRKKDAFEFSFLLSIPAILGSSLLSLKNIYTLQNAGDFAIQLIGGIIASFLIGLLALKVLEKMLLKEKLYIFSIYLWILSTVIFILL